MKKLLIFLLLFSSCKKDDNSQQRQKPAIHVTFQEYPSGKLMTQLPVRIGFEKMNTWFDYTFVEDRSGTTDYRGSFSFNQFSCGQYIRSGSTEHVDFSYHVPGYQFNDQPVGYGAGPSNYPEAAQTKREDQDIYFHIPLFRKTEIQFRLKQVTPTSQFDPGVSVAVSNQAYEHDTTGTPIEYWSVMNWVDLKNDVLIDTVITVPFFTDFNNCVVTSVRDLGGFNNLYVVERKTPKFTPVNGQKMITLEF